MGKITAIFFLICVLPLSIDAQPVDDVGSGRAIKFDGDDFLDLGNVYDNLTFPFTISAWIKMDPSNYIGPLFVTQDNTPWYNGFWLVITQNSISFEFGDGFGENHPIYRKGLGLQVSGLSGRWVHITGVMRSRASMDIYINGLLQPSYPTGDSESTMDSNFPDDDAKMGTWTSNGITQFYRGLMDEVRFYNRALSPSEIQETMCRRLTGNEPGLIGYWNFDETSGNIVKDSSPNGNDGVFAGSPGRVFSGAPIGDESFINYSNNVAELSWNDITVTGIQSNAKGVQIYKVNHIPSQTEGLDASEMGPYYGVYLANFSGSKTFSLSENCVMTREDNSVARWKARVPEDLVTRSEFIKTSDLPTPIQVELGNDILVCPGNYTIDTGFDPAGKDFLWSTGETASAISVKSPGTYSVTVSEGCNTGQDEITVSFLPAPQIDLQLGPDVQMCGYGPYLLESKVGETPTRIFSWNTGANAPQVNVTNSGVYKVTIEDGCTLVRDSVVVTMIPIHPIEVSLGSDRSVCPAPYILDPAVDPMGRSFKWSTGETTPTITIPTPGTYSVEVRDGCDIGQDAVSVSFLSVPVIDLELGDDIELCGAGPYLIDTKLEPTGRVFKWNTSESSPQISVSGSGQYKVTIQEGCATVSDSVLVTFIPIPVINFDLGPNRVICPGEVIELSGPDLPGLSYQWSNGETEPVIAVGDEGHFTLKFSGVCVEGDDDIDLLHLNTARSHERFIPNIITPNGDNKNEFFQVDRLIDKPIGIQVFNRWGRLLMEDPDYQNNWNGNGLSDGVYFYNLRDECGNILKGAITISN